MTRAYESVAPTTLTFGPFHLTRSTRLLTRDGTPVAIGARALDILGVLVGNAGEVVDKREILHRVWPNTPAQESNLRVHLTVLRRVLGDGVDGGRYIVNVCGRGYAFVAPVQQCGTAVTSRARLAGLPLPAPRLAGRDPLLAAVLEQVLTGPLTSLVGPPGVGKTSVAVVAAHMLLPRFGDDAVCFVDLSAITDTAVVPAAIAAAIAAALGVPPMELGRDLDVAALLSGRRMLCVLDNCEHVVETIATFAARLMRTAPEVHLLATSREALRIEGERVRLVGPLGVPTSATPTAHEALAAPAVQLFMARAAAAGYPFGLGNDDAPVVAKICRRLDGVPLAIALVASRVPTHGILGTAELVDRDCELLIPGPRGCPRRHQTLEAMLDWSYALLDRDEQRVFRRLAIFAGPFTLDAAEAVAGDGPEDSAMIARAISGLSCKSLLSLSCHRGKTLYRMLETTRVYAAGRLDDSGEGDSIAARHARYV